MLVYAPTRPYLLDAFQLRGVHRRVVPNPHRSRLRIDVCALTGILVRGIVIDYLSTAFFTWKRIRLALAQNVEQVWSKQQIAVERAIEGVVSDPPIFPGYGDDGISPRLLVRIADLCLGKRLIDDTFIALDETGRIDSEELRYTRIGCEVHNSPTCPGDRPPLPDMPHHAEEDSLPGRREHDILTAEKEQRVPVNIEQNSSLCPDIIQQAISSGAFVPNICKRRLRAIDD